MPLRQSLLFPDPLPPNARQQAPAPAVADKGDRLSMEAVRAIQRLSELPVVTRLVVGPFLLGIVLCGFGTAEVFAETPIGQPAVTTSVASPSAAPTDPETARRQAAVALNYSRAALHRLRQNPSVRVLLEEQEKILNHLNLNGIADPEVLQLYAAVLDEIAQVQIADRERDALRDRYKNLVRQQLGTNAFVLATEVASAQFGSAVRTGANSWWDYRSQGFNRDLDLWKVDRQRMTAVMAKSTQFLDTSWKLARDKQIPDRWLVRGDDLDKLEAACREPDPTIRLRVLKRMESFLECYPPYWYYLARTEQSLGQLAEAADTYRQLARLETGHFRKDEMLAAALANQAAIESFLVQPNAAQTAHRALDHATDAWEANLICAAVLERCGEHDAAEEALLRNLDVGLERTQSQQVLLALYCKTDQKTKLARRLDDPQLVREVPAPLLLACAVKLGNDSVPTIVWDQLSNTLQVGPRLTFGRDDLLVATTQQWLLPQAQATLLHGEQTFAAGKVQAGRDSLQRESSLIAFESVAELGQPVGGNGTAGNGRAPVVLVLKYPNLPPFRLSLERNADPGTQLVARRPPSYRLVSVEQDEERLILLPPEEIEPPARSDNPVRLLPPNDATSWRQREGAWGWNWN